MEIVHIMEFNKLNVKINNCLRLLDMTIDKLIDCNVEKVELH